ncbi:MAG: hypothetical protein M0Z51_02210 [Propionibacterium sp.]|nr:hypothetical protein [Propionibacterium sp.]
MTSPASSRSRRTRGSAPRTGDDDRPAPTPGVDVIRIGTPTPRLRVRRAPHHWLQTDVDDVSAPVPADRLEQILRELVPTGASGIDEVLLLGDGPTAEAIGSLLLRLCPSELLLCRDPSHPRDPPVDWQTALIARRPPGRHPARWSLAQPDDAWKPGGLVVVATDSAEPDRVLLRRLVRRGADHVVVRIHQGIAMVGPWVRPHTTPCLECHDHWLAGHDRDYAMVLNDLEQRRAVVDDASVTWAAAVLVRHLTSPDAGRGALSGLIELADPLFPTLRTLPINRHPGCRCARP